ncbi:hypothetical protein BKA61DRAFT_684135 [Leptodontidium sp. MPI-SDFR-AT-0119]|nr:hypothetical protein BKA61DRAFT_684135 [Leptodontidium sp. MPI-SDFR-AT-0119]
MTLLTRFGEMVIQIPKLVIHRACGYEHTVPRMKRIPDLKAAKRAITLQPRLDHLKMVQLLLEHGADNRHRDYEGIAPLSTAAYAGHGESVICTLDAMESGGCTKEEIIGSSVTKNSVLHLVASKAHVDVLKILINRLGIIQPPGNPTDDPFNIMITIIDTNININTAMIISPLLVVDI